MNYRKRKKAAMGFYVCAGLCLVAIGIAALVSYQSVVKAPINNDNEDTHSKIEDNSSKSNGINGNINTVIPNVIENKKNDNTVETVTNEQINPTEITDKEDEEEADEEDTPEENTIAPIPTVVSPTHFVLPAKATVKKGFSNNTPVYSETMRDYRVHNAVDYDGEFGQKICAVADGMVENIYSDAMLGNIIIIRHGKYLVSYCGMDKNAVVTVGQSVKIGEEIGTLSEVPCEILDGAHLHLEIHENGILINAEEILPR